VEIRTVDHDLDALRRIEARITGLVREWCLPQPTGILPDSGPVEVEHTVGEGETTDLPADLHVIDTPGHTPGHVSYLLRREGGLLIVGDAAVAKRGEIKLGWLNRGQPACDTGIRHIAEYDFDVACFGHAAPLRPAASDAFRILAESRKKRVE